MVTPATRSARHDHGPRRRQHGHTWSRPRLGTRQGPFEGLTLTGSAAIGGTGNALANVITGTGVTNFLIQSGFVGSAHAESAMGSNDCPRCRHLDAWHMFRCD